MNLNVAMCDDEIDGITAIRQQLLRYSISSDVEFKAKEFTSARTLLNSISEGNTYDIVFLDVEMPEMNGIALAKAVLEMSPRKPYLVFVSNYPKYMRDSFSVHPFQYLQKPFSDDDMDTLIKDIINDYMENTVHFTLVGSTLGDYNLPISDIYYIESTNSRRKELCVHTKNTGYLTIGTLKDWKERLSDYFFIRCSRDTLVNTQHIHFFDTSVILLDNDNRIPFSRRKRQELIDYYKKSLMILTGRKK